MPIQDYINYKYMMEKVEETLLFSAVRLEFVVDHDVFGGEVNAYLPQETFPCSAVVLRQADRANFTGVDVDTDLRLRIPHENWANFGPRDRIKVIPDSDSTMPEVYEIVGHGFTSLSIVILELNRVSEHTELDMANYVTMQELQTLLANYALLSDITSVTDRVSTLEHQLGDVEVSHGGRSLSDVLVLLEKRVHALEILAGTVVSTPPFVIPVSGANGLNVKALAGNIGPDFLDGAERRVVFEWAQGESSAGFTGNVAGNASFEYPEGSSHGILQIAGGHNVDNRTMMAWADGDMVITLYWDQVSYKHQVTHVEHLSA
jgi:hypothetical protein